jgi:hypothetical protein
MGLSTADGAGRGIGRRGSKTVTGSGGVTRRELLAGIGMAGAAIGSSAVGHSTASAFLHDTESFVGNVVATGEVDLDIGYTASYDGADGSALEVDGNVNGDPIDGLEIPEIVSGDSGSISLCPSIAGNPSYLWLCGGVRKSEENGKAEAEDEHIGDVVWPPDGKGGEVEDAMQVVLSYTDGSDTLVELFRGSFGELLEVLQYGIALTAEPDTDATGYRVFTRPGDQVAIVEDGNPCLQLDWWVPEGTGNTIMTDEFEFELAFHAQQRRHNAGTNNPCAVRKGISFVSFCAEGSDAPSGARVTGVTETNGEGEPVALEWESDEPVDTVVLKYGQVFEDFAVDGATSGTVAVGTGNVRFSQKMALWEQTPSDPCPDGETGVKYDYEGGAFVDDE